VISVEEYTLICIIIAVTKTAVGPKTWRTTFRVPTHLRSGWTVNAGEGVMSRAAICQTTRKGIQGENRYPYTLYSIQYTIFKCVCTYLCICVLCIYMYTSTYYRQPRLVNSDTYSATIVIWMSTTITTLRVVSMVTNIDIFGEGKKTLIIMRIGIAAYSMPTSHLQDLR